MEGPDRGGLISQVGAGASPKSLTMMTNLISKMLVSTVMIEIGRFSFNALLVITSLVSPGFLQERHRAICCSQGQGLLQGHAQIRHAYNLLDIAA